MISVTEEICFETYKLAYMHGTPGVFLLGPDQIYYSGSRL